MTRSAKTRHVLFVCSQNKLRSPTAAQVFAGHAGIVTDSAGTHRGADVELCEEHILWADLIFVMEHAHRRRIQQKFRSQLTHQRLICLNIPDDYDFMAPALVSLLRKKVTPFL
jgi:predicted protein tyrosine phosphatase